MSDDEFHRRGGHFILLYAVVELDDLVFVVGDVCVERPHEALGCDDRTGEVDFGAAVDHHADVVPIVSVTLVGVGLGHLHEHVGGAFVVEFEVDVEPVPESEVEGEVRGPELLPPEVLAGGLAGGHTGIAVVVEASAHEGQVHVVVRYGGVARGTGADGDLGVGEPAPCPLHETFVAEVPHEAQGPESGPAAVGAEARRGVGTDREVGIVAVVVVVLATPEEREVGIVVVGGVEPRRGAGAGGDIDEFVVVLAFGEDREVLVVVVEALLAEEEVEGVLAVYAELVVQGIGDREREAVGGHALGASFAEVGGVARGRGSEAGGVGVVDVELRFEGQTVDDGCFGEDTRHEFVFLVFAAVVFEPFEGVQAVTLPASVVHRGERPVGTVGVPVGEHEAGGGDRRHDGVFAVVGLLDVLVVEHGVGSDLEPLGGALFDIGAEGVAVEIGADGDTVLAVVASGNEVIGLFVGARDGEFVVLEQGAAVVDFVEPADVDLAEPVVVFSGGESDLLFILDSLGGVHQVPVSLGELGEAELHPVGDVGFVGHSSALGGDHDHAVCGAGSVDRGRRGVLQHGDRLDVGGIDGVEVAA